MSPLPLLLSYPDQLVVGAGLAVTVIELDLELQGLLEVLLGLLPLPLYLSYPAQLGVGLGLQSLCFLLIQLSSLWYQPQYLLIRAFCCRELLEAKLLIRGAARDVGEFNSSRPGQFFCREAL